MSDDSKKTEEASRKKTISRQARRSWFVAGVQQSKIFFVQPYRLLISRPFNGRGRQQSSYGWCRITCRWYLQSLCLLGFFTWMCQGELWLLSPGAFCGHQWATAESEARCHQGQTHWDLFDSRGWREASAIARRGCQTPLRTEHAPWQLRGGLRQYFHWDVGAKTGSIGGIGCVCLENWPKPQKKRFSSQFLSTFALESRVFGGFQLRIITFLERPSFEVRRLRPGCPDLLVSL